MLTFYESHNFALFPCNENKTPKVPSWQSSKYHIDIATASRLMDTDNYVGAWIPPDFVIIDLDRGHKDKEGKEKPDGVENFTQLCADLGISSNLPNETMAVKTGSGGIHLYFKTPKECDYHTLAQKAIVPSVDVNTHHGYVIASGTRGYNPLNECEPIEIPPELLSAIQKRAVEKAPPLSPDRQLSVKFLKRLLNKIPATDFNTSDSWQEFITSCIAVAGNSEEVVEVLEDWSRSDDNYKNDPSIRTRIESFEPDGGIKAGTFIYILKQQRLSEYLVTQVRTAVGARFTFSQGFSDSYEPPFSVDYS